MILNRLLFALAICTVGCNRAFSPGEPLVGTWGGNGVSASLTASGGGLSFVCGEASLDAPLVPDSRGRVSSTGMASPVGGAARPIDYVPEMHPVRFSGDVDGPKLTLTLIRTDIANAERGGPYVLYRGKPGDVNGCPMAAPH
jgi:hypothetical protein